MVAVNPGEDGFEHIMIGAAWDNVKTKNAGFFSGLFKKARKVGVDLDVGCLYELQDGTRGALQAFGEKFGQLDYIYKGVLDWSELKPQLVVDVPGENDLYVTLQHHNDALDICAVGGLENVRGGIKLTNYTEYFPGHMEMDRAFGFGLDWADGSKD